MEKKFGRGEVKIGRNRKTKEGKKLYTSLTLII